VVTPDASSDAHHYKTASGTVHLFTQEKMHMNYQQRITIEPGKRGGKPCVRGLRISVYDVLEQLAAGLSQNDILEDFPELEPEDIAACLAFAADREHRLGGIAAR
jgi:uncharacterized protein (DUF433 family)